MIAPAGMLCGECGTGRKSPLFVVSGPNLARAILITGAVSAFGGWLLADIGGFGLFVLWFAFLYGLAVGEVALRATGRKRGQVMEILAGCCAGGGIIAGWLLQWAQLSADQAVPLGHILRTHLLNPIALLIPIIAIVVAVSRIRSL